MPFGMSALEVIFSIIFTWGIGLAPALIARYLWFKRPLPRRTANWIAGVSCAVFWVGARALNAAARVEPEDTTRGFVWVVVFFVSRWLMNRGHEPEVAEVAEVAEVPQNDPKHTRAEMIARLEAMVGDPALSERERAAAEERLNRLQAMTRT